MKRRWRTQMIRQMSPTECAAASLAMICSFHGISISLREIRKMTNVGRNGCNAGSLIRVAKELGLEAHGYKKDWRQLESLPMPCILFWQENHFLVLEGIHKKRVYISDPAKGRRKLSLEELKDNYSGIVLTFLPGKNFTKQNVREINEWNNDNRIIWERIKKHKDKVTLVNVCFGVELFILPLGVYLLFKKEPLAVLFFSILAILVYIQDTIAKSFYYETSLETTYELITGVFQEKSEHRLQKNAAEVVLAMRHNDKLNRFLKSHLFLPFLWLAEKINATNISYSIQEINDIKGNGNGLPCKEKESKDAVDTNGTISFEQVTYGYESGRTFLVEDLSFLVRQGDCLHIAGESGCGKTTLLRLIKGELQPLEGCISIGGNPMEAYEKQTIEYVSDRNVIFFGTVRDNLTMWNPIISDKQVLQALEAVGINEQGYNRQEFLNFILEENGTNLSGGMRQKLAIARALVAEPNILLLDGATSALSPLEVNHLLDYAKKRGITCILATSDADERFSCDGKLEWDGHFIWHDFASSRKIYETKRKENAFFVQTGSANVFLTDQKGHRIFLYEAKEGETIPSYCGEDSHANALWFTVIPNLLCENGHSSFKWSQVEAIQEGNTIPLKTGFLRKLGMEAEGRNFDVCMEEFYRTNSLKMLTRQRKTRQYENNIYSVIVELLAQKSSEKSAKRTAYFVAEKELYYLLSDQKTLENQCTQLYAIYKVLYLYSCAFMQQDFSWRTSFDFAFLRGKALLEKEEPKNSDNKKTSLQLKNVRYSYKNSEKPVIWNLNLSLAEGESLGICGESGSGKSTLAALLYGQIYPDAGQILINGIDTHLLTSDAKKDYIGYYSPQKSLVAGSIYDNIKVETENLTKEQAREVLQLVGFEDTLMTMPMGLETMVSEVSGELSYGERQKVLLATVLAKRPQLLLVDEPVGLSLDELKEILAQARIWGCICIIFSQNEEIGKLCDRSIYM